MAKKKTQEVKLRRSCGAMAAHMMLLEKYPSFRLAQMRLEGAAARQHQLGFDAAKAKIVTVNVVVNVVYKTDEQNISDAQINSQIVALNQGLSRDESRQESDARAMERLGHRCAFAIQARENDADEDDENRLHRGR